ncbi:hypothetical protein Gpo141_00006159 [Globisporangium polare]
MRVFLAWIALTAAAAAADDTATYSLGAWLAATSSDATLEVLDVALRDHSAGLHVPPSIAAQASPKICFEQVHAVEQQIVNGINFRYHVTGCALPADDDSTFGSAEPLPRSGRCARACNAQQRAAFQVTVFCQPWTQTARVLSIETEGASATA